jgi:hypothetical protein
MSRRLDRLDQLVRRSFGRVVLDGNGLRLEDHVCRMDARDFTQTAFDLRDTGCAVRSLDRQDLAQISTRVAGRVVRCHLSYGGAWRKRPQNPRSQARSREDNDQHARN